jgi:hypothetical protein
MTTVRNYHAHGLVSIHRRTEGSAGARSEIGYSRKNGRKSGVEATSRHPAVVERERVARGDTRYGHLPAELAAK